MCFSAEASFAGAALVGLIGILNVCTASKKQLLFACIPFWFAIQQLIEGFIWLAYTYGIGSYEHVAYAGKFAYLAIAFGVWPFWISLSLLPLETIRWRRLVLWLLLATGAIYSIMRLALLLYGWSDGDIQTNIVGQHIVYLFPVEYLMLTGIMYIVLTLLPQFISSYRGIIFLGIGNTLGFIAAYYLYSVAFVSVWCFFAAWVSLGTYTILRLNKQH